jgi:hypothetical protein
MVVFNEKAHTYTNATGEKYISVTTLLNKYKPQFDSHYWSTYKAMKDVLEKKGEWAAYKKRAGAWDRVVDYVRYVDKSFPYRSEVMEAKKEYLKSWRETKDSAAERGTEFHKMKESQTAGSGYNFEGIVYNTLAGSPFIEPDYITSGVYPELLLFDHEFKLAGQADVVIKNGKSVSILDYKTSKSIEKTAFQSQTLLYPLDHMPNANFYIYTMQLSLYAYMLERQGYEIGRLQIHHINRETFDLIECHEVEYYPDEVKHLIKHYCEERDKTTGKLAGLEEGSDEVIIVPLEDEGS